MKLTFLDNAVIYIHRMKPIQLDPTRQNLKSRPKGLTEQEYFQIALKEGYALLKADPKHSTPHSVTSSIMSKVYTTLGKMSNNPYTRAWAQLLAKMRPEVRSVIEDMINGKILKDQRYDTFCRSVTELGDLLSAKN
jgi:hypothetical protein